MAPLLKEMANLHQSLAVEDETMAGDVMRVFAERRLPTSLVPTFDPSHPISGLACKTPLSNKQAGQMAAACQRALERGRPMAILHPFPRTSASQMAIHYLRAYGAFVTEDPDVWTEGLVLLAHFGLPKSSRLAIIAEPGSWLFGSAVALREETAGGRENAQLLARDSKSVADVLLCDPVQLDQISDDKRRTIQVIPVVSRVELLGTRPALIGLRAAWRAALLLGRLTEQLRAGIGVATAEAVKETKPDLERFERQLGKLRDRAADHEAKVLLASFGVAITRQAVATTASSATQIAKRAGLPVDIKPWGDVASELEGCPVAENLRSTADVRRGFAEIAALAPSGSVIVRGSPPAGREIRVQCTKDSDLGWMMRLTADGMPDVSAPCPLTEGAALELAGHLAASRARDAAPNHTGFAELLRRLSFVTTHAKIANIDCFRVIVPPEGATPLVVDVRILLN